MSRGGKCVEEVTSEVQSPLPGTQGAQAFPTASVFEANMLMPPYIVYWCVI